MVSPIPSADNDCPLGLQQVTMSDNFDFSRPKESPISSTTPLDINQVEDGDPFIIQVQSYLKNNPLGKKYSGEINGIKDQELLNLLSEFEIALQAQTGKSIIGSIVSGSKISPKGFNRAISLLGKPEQQSEVPKSETPSDSIIKSFQALFTSELPGLGKLYQGPMDGLANDSLIQAAQQIEQYIAQKINNQKAVGMIWSGQKFNTSPQDVKNSLELIYKNSNNSL